MRTFALAAGIVLASSFAPSSARADEAPLPSVAQPAPPPTAAPRELTRAERKQWRKDDPIPPGYHAEERMRIGLVIPGAVIFGLSYGLAVWGGIAGTGLEHALLIPIAGPFIAGTDTNGLGTVLFFVDGICQIAGATMLALGIALPKTTLVSNTEGALHVTPMVVGRDGYGLGLGGAF